MATIPQFTKKLREDGARVLPNRREEDEYLGLAGNCSQLFQTTPRPLEQLNKQALLQFPTVLIIWDTIILLKKVISSPPITSAFYPLECLTLWGQWPEPKIARKWSKSILKSNNITLQILIKQILTSVKLSPLPPYQKIIFQKKKLSGKGGMPPPLTENRHQKIATKWFKMG